MSEQARAGDAAVTISVGVATADPQSHPSTAVDWLQNAADAALYQAKSEGRHRVKVA
jgi:diguanylate cyclase (GGDEF)-like protein